MSQKNELPKTKWELAEVPIDLVDMPANPTNKTKQASLTAQGFAERIILVPNGERYKVQNGRRRIADAKALGESVVPALVRHTDEKGRLLGGLSAQLGQTKSPITDARNISRLQSEFGMTQQQIAQEVGCSQGSISQVLSLLKLPEFLQERLHMNQVTFSTARLLVKLLKLKPDLEPALVKMKTITEDWVDGQYRAAQSANAGLDDLRQPDEDFREMLGLTPLPEPTPDNIALTVSLTNCNMAELRMGNEIEIKIDGQMYVISAS